MDEYDEFRDRIICSEDFENCTNKDVEGTCLLSKGKVKCWHLFRCPAGYKRE